MNIISYFNKFVEESFNNFLKKYFYHKFIIRQTIKLYQAKLLHLLV